MHALLPLALIALSSLPPQAPQQREHFLAVYEVSDLLADQAFFSQVPELGVSRPPPKVQPAQAAPAGARPPAPRPDPERQAQLELERHRRRVEATEALAELVRSFLEPPLDPQRDELRVLAPGSLALVGGAAQHAWVESFLAVQRSHGGMVEVVAEIIQMPRPSLEDVGVQCADVLASAQERERALEALKAAPGAEFLNAQTLVTFPRVPAAISITDHFSYVKDWDLRTVEPGGQEIADPLVHVIEEGLCTWASAALLEHGLWGLKLRVERAEVRRPVATAQVDLAGRRVEVALPEVDSVAIDSALRLEDGASTVLTVPQANAERVLVVVVTVRAAKR